MSLRIRRGSDAERLAVRFDQGEIVWVNSTTTSRPAYKLYVGDGVTYGGRDIVETSAGNKLTYNTNTGRLDVTGLTTDDIAPGTNNKFFTNELAQDAVGAMFAAGTMSGIQFVYDDVGNRMNVTVTATGGGGGGGSGIAALVNDPSPHLGGSLDLNNQNIVGTGNINITGNVTATGTIAVTTGLGANLPLNGFDLSGTGNINITGDIHATGTIIAGGGLGANLALNNHNITGDGSININGSISSVIGLGGNLPLNSHNITGNGNIILDSGSLTLSSGNAALTAGSLIISSGNITANGSISDTVVSIKSGVITSATNQITVGKPDALSSTTMLFNQVNSFPSLYIKNHAGTLDQVSKVVFDGYKGTLASLSGLNPGDNVGVFSFGALEPISGNSLPTCLISASVDANGVINSEVANGKLTFATTGGTSSGTFTIKFLTFDSNGRLAVNQDTAATTLDVNGTFRFNTLTPASSSSVGVAGQMAWDGSYIYVCTATNTWKRTPLTTW